MIQKAKLKKQYAKLKAREQQATQENEALSRPTSHIPGSPKEDDEAVVEHLTEQNDFDGFSTEPSEPDKTISPSPPPKKPFSAHRLSEVDEASSEQVQDERMHPDRRRRARPQTFAKEAAYASKKRAEAQERKNAKEEATRQRQQKLEGRERFRKAMAKAKAPGRDGKRKLGRESKVLLEKVQKMVAS